MAGTLWVKESVLAGGDEGERGARMAEATSLREGELPEGGKSAWAAICAGGEVREQEGGLKSAGCGAKPSDALPGRTKRPPLRVR